MSQVKQKVIPLAKVETITRKKLLQNTASEVLHLFRPYHDHCAQWLIDRLPAIVEHELLVGFELAAFSGDEPVTTIGVNFDWNEHRVQQNIKNEIDIADLEDGKTHTSTREVVGVVRNYLEQVNASVPNVRYEIWFFRNRVVRQQLGAEKFYEFLGCEGSEESERAAARRYKRISVMKVGRAVRKIFFPGAEESSLDIH